ncbi:MAG: HAD family hydrolase [Cyanobacteria bacterium NC_groundwater_1444_Ag_S-0.65um_54_12]|nr:HAD family hydrolase [Cyanobacteria bacterium NC_groundwater_1444_Ag_S-0.65um_54_12]
MKLAVFLDRDGTINEEAGYIRDLNDFRLISGAASAIRRLNRAGLLAILVTNQSGPARGYYPESWVRRVLDRLTELLLAQDAHLDDMLYCPHLPPKAGGKVTGYAITCECRKPGTLLLREAAARHGIDLARSYVVGDKATDVELGRNAGCRAILLETGYGKEVLAGRYQWPVQADHVALDLAAAVDWILADLPTSFATTVT